MAEAATVKIITLDVTLRDWFAGMALQGLLGSDSHPDIDPLTLPGDINLRAMWAYRLADAMLAARQKPPNQP